MDPVMINLGPVTLRWYGVLFASGFVAAAIHWTCLERRARVPRGFGLELCIWVIVSSVAGARLAFVLSNWEVFASDPARIGRIDQGGLVFYGGLLGAITAGSLLAHLRRIPFWRMADYAISAVPLGHAIGRVGCFLNGCCYGAVSDHWWAIPAGGAMRHPVQIVETTLNMALYIVCLQLYLRRHREGRVFALYLMIYPLTRFLLEFLRGDERMPGLALNVAQELSLLFMALGAVLWITLPRKRHYTPPLDHADV